MFHQVRNQKIYELVLVLLPLAAIAIYLLVTGRRYPTGAWLGIMWLIGLWMLVYTSHQMRGYFASDELYFATEPPGGLLSNRFLWLVLNRIVGQFHEQPEKIVMHMRVFNLSLLVVIYLYAVTKIRTIPPFLLAIGMSYFACVAALNLRDTAVLLVTWMFLNTRAELGHSIRDQMMALKRAPFAFVLLILLRPLQSVQLFVSGFRLLYVGGFLFLFLAFLQTPLGNQYFYNYAYFYNNFESVVVEKAEDKGFYGAKPTPQYITYWTARFILAPTPTSVAKRFLTDNGEYEYGRVDLGARVINRLALFTCFIAVFYYMLKYRQVTIYVLKRDAFILKFGLIFSLTYAIFNFGASHERVKLNLLVLMLTLVNHIRLELCKHKKARENHLSHSHQLA